MAFEPFSPCDDCCDQILALVQYARVPAPEVAADPVGVPDNPAQTCLMQLVQPSQTSAPGSPSMRLTHVRPPAEGLQDVYSCSTQKPSTLTFSGYSAYYPGSQVSVLGAARDRLEALWESWFESVGLKTDGDYFDGRFSWGFWRQSLLVGTLPSFSLDIGPTLDLDGYSREKKFSQMIGGYSTGLYGTILRGWVSYDALGGYVPFLDPAELAAAGFGSVVEAYDSMWDYLGIKEADPGLGITATFVAQNDSTYVLTGSGISSAAGVSADVGLITLGGWYSPWMIGTAVGIVEDLYPWDSSPRTTFWSHIHEVTPSSRLKLAWADEMLAQYGSYIAGSATRFAVGGAQAESYIARVTLMRLPLDLELTEGQMPTSRDVIVGGGCGVTGRKFGPPGTHADAASYPSWIDLDDQLDYQFGYRLDESVAEETTVDLACTWDSDLGMHVSTPLNVIPVESDRGYCYVLKTVKRVDA